MPIILRKSRRPDLESHLKGAVHRWLASCGYLPFEEVRTSWGIVDIVGIRINLEKVLERVRAGYKDSIGDFRTVLVLLAVPTERSRNSISREKLDAEFGELLGKHALDRIINKLLRKRMIALTPSKRLVRMILDLPYHDELVCIELKLSRIDEVIAQACRHKVAATSSYVGLPQDVAERISTTRRLKFQETGLGLIGITQDTCSVLITARPTGSERERSHEITVSEKSWSAVLKTIQH
jgi:hypothetical protein